MAVIKEYKDGNTKIIIKDDYMPKTEAERRQRHEHLCKVVSGIYAAKHKREMEKLAQERKEG